MGTSGVYEITREQDNVRVPQGAGAGERQWCSTSPGAWKSPKGAEKKSNYQKLNLVPLP